MYNTLLFSWRTRRHVSTHARDVINPAGRFIQLKTESSHHLQCGLKTSSRLLKDQRPGAWRPVRSLVHNGVPGLSAQSQWAMYAGLTLLAGCWKVVARLFKPEEFDASKLTVAFQGQLPNARNGLSDLEKFLPRKYTLTHSDYSGELLLSIGSSYDQQQLEGWYTRLMRDEVIAEWQAKGRLSLHVHCHVSGGHCLLAPAALRYRIFQREMPLVLQAIRYGDDAMISEHPEFDKSNVWVHYHSDDAEFSRADCWGPLFSAANGFTNFHRQATIQPKLLAFM